VHDAADNTNAKTIDQCIFTLAKQYNIIDVIYCDQYNNNWIDLYNRIQQVHKSSYNANERILFVITSELYNKKVTNGLILQSIQAICNDVDISNFFCCILSTNANVLTEYNRVFSEHNIDPVPMNIQLCKGKFTSNFDVSTEPFKKMYNIKSTLPSIDHITAQQRKLLFEDDVFCIAPWTSMMISPDNKVRPCCAFSQSIGDSGTQSLSEIWNSVQARELRSTIMKGKKHDGCLDCYKKEAYGSDSLRNSLNRRFAKHIDRFDKTDETGFFEPFNLVYLDSRFNNLCNLSCRSCNHNSSSSWHKPATTLGLIAKDTPVFLTGGRYKNDLLQQIVKHANSLESIYFAGGEPLLIEEFYSILDYLDKNKKHNIELIYNTNLSKLGLPKKSIFDSWKNFTNISVGASLDAEGARAEYLRTGTKWQNVLNFRAEMLEKRPDIDFYINATVSILNVLHVPDFHRSWVEKGLINAEQFSINFLFTPEYMKIDSAPTVFKDKIQEKYLAHLDWLRPQDTLGRATNGYESILKQIDNNTSFDRKLFWDNVQLLDNYYNTDLLTTFPELRDLK